MQGQVRNQLGLLALVAVLASCGSNPPAPVIDRQPASKPAASAPAPATSTTPSPKTTKPATNRPTYKAGDWRPSTYTVKKGDTLFSIGLEYGYDYKELAQANNIPPPYNIRIGQTLTLAGSDDKQMAGTANSDGVVTFPMNNDGGISTAPAQSGTKASGGVVALSEPKAIREPFSQKALENVAIVPPKTADKTVEKASDKPADKATDKSSDKPTTADKTTPVATVKPDTKPDSKADTKSDDAAEDIDWAWPTKGKVVAGFNESSNKGLDIAGTSGQAITAAAPGKVIYSGSDLRGYGKLVIIKHTKNYLSVYAHNSAIVVKEGQQVTRGQKIAEMGNTDSDTVKLHFEIRRQGKSVDPSKYLSAN